MSDPEKQKQVVVHFVIGRCLSREMLLHFADKGITFFGKGWTQACTKIAAEFWRQGGSVYVPEVGFGHKAASSEFGVPMQGASEQQGAMSPTVLENIRSHNAKRGKNT